MTDRGNHRDLSEEEEIGVKCVCIKDAPLKVDLIWTHAIIQRVSGRRNNLLKTVTVRLVSGWSPNGRTEFDMPATEKVNIPIITRPDSSQKHANLRPHRRQPKLSQSSSYAPA